MSEEMDIVNTWCNETDVLLDEYDVMEGKLQEMNVGYKSGEPAETGEQEGKETKREKRARMKEEKALLREEMIQQIEKLSVSFKFSNFELSLVSSCSNTLSIRDDPYTSRKNSLELIELSSINKVSLV